MPSTSNPDPKVNPVTLRFALLPSVATIIAGPALAEVTGATGLTPIPNGEGAAAGDITVSNGNLACTSAVEPLTPWLRRTGLRQVSPFLDFLLVGLHRHH